MTGQELYERFAALLGVEPRWPDHPTTHVDRTTQRAWDTLAIEVEHECRERIAKAIAHREQADRNRIFGDRLERGESV